jgi:hypothetical protein
MLSLVAVKQSVGNLSTAEAVGGLSVALAQSGREELQGTIL